MSTTATARRAAAPSRRTQPARPPLRLVAPTPRHVPRAPYVLLSLGVVVGGLIALLVLNTVVSQDAFTVHELERRTAALREQEQQLRREVAALEAPAALAAQATKLGLVPAGDPVFLRLSDGKVLGVPKAATAPPKPVAPKPAAVQPSPGASAPPGAQPTTKPATKPTTSPAAAGTRP